MTVGNLDIARLLGENPDLAKSTKASVAAVEQSFFTRRTFAGGRSHFSDRRSLPSVSKRREVHSSYNLNSLRKPLTLATVRSGSADNERTSFSTVDVANVRLCSVREVTELIC